MNSIVLSTEDTSAWHRFQEHAQTWRIAHQAEIGVAEMALGAALLAWGVSSGQFLMGEDILASKLSDIGSAAGAVVGGTAGAALAATVLHGLFVGGVAYVQGVTAVPALILIGGGALVLSAFGYTAGDVVGRLIGSPGIDDILLAGSALAVGMALLIDGARRFVKDERILAASARLADGVIYLYKRSGDIAASTQEELHKVAEELSVNAGAATASSSAVAIAGGALGATLAAGSVTVLGSHALGAGALAMGIVSAPVWPIIAGGAAGMSVGVLAFVAARRYLQRKRW